MNHPRGRTPWVVGLPSLALVLACGGGGGGPADPGGGTNNPPTNLSISGPGSGISKHPLNYLLSASDPEGDTFTFSSTTPGAVIPGGGVNLTWTPPQSGSLPLSVVATDSRGKASAPKEITVAIAPNASPTFTSPATAQFTNAASGNPPTYTYQPTATDADGDTVVFVLVPASVEEALDPPGGTGAFVPGSDALVSVAGPGSANAVFSITSAVPNGFVARRVRFKARAQDRLPGSSELLGAQTDLTVTMTVFGLNLPPVIAAFTLPEIRVNHPMVGFQFTASDANGDPLTWSLVSVTPSAAGLALSSGGLLTWPSAPDTTPRTVTLKVADGRGGEDSRTFILTPLPDSLPEFTPTPTYTTTVGGVPFHEPLNLQRNIWSRFRFHYEDPLATDGEFVASDSVLSPKGWRASVLAVDADQDGVVYGVKPGSVFRHGLPFLDTASPSYPTVNPTTGELTWRPNRTRSTGPSSQGDGVALSTDPANWRFTLVAQELLGGAPVPGLQGETTLTIRVLPNTPPQVGPLRTLIGSSTLNFGVQFGGGTALGGWGRPSLTEPLASETETPGTPSKWVWQVQGPGTPTVELQDISIWDADALATEGHMDALQLYFGTRSLTADGQVLGPVEGLKSGVHYPALDTTGNLPSLITSASIIEGFYNPWLHGASSLGRWEVQWAPVHSQVTLDRYLGSRVFSFPVTAQDQYGQALVHLRKISPLFGSVGLFNHRFQARRDTLEDAYAPKGEFLATGNAASGGNRYIFSYLPFGRSSAPGSEEFLQGAATYGGSLFGDFDSGGAPASGYFFSLGAPSPTAASWLTVDGLRVGSSGLYPPSPFNEVLHYPASAGGTPGTAQGAPRTVVQFKGGAGQGLMGQATKGTRTVSGPWADAEIRAFGVPSTSPWLATVRNGVRPWAGDGLATPRHLGLPTTDRRWLYGRYQSDVDLLQTLTGRPVLLSQLAVPTVDVDELSTAFTRWAALRVTFSWPTVVTQSAPGWPVAGGANGIQESDVWQVTTPNMSGNARFFFTGNTPGVSPGSDKLAGNYLGKFGFTTLPGAFLGTGATRTAAPHQPIHAVTRSLWVPNNSDGRNNLPNAYTTPIGGGLFCDIPFAGIRGYLGTTATQGLGQLWVGGDEWLDQPQSVLNSLAVAMNPANPSATGLAEDAHANPALLDGPIEKDRVFFLWMKQDQGGSSNAYGTWGGAVLKQGTSHVVLGGLTTIVEPLTMGQTLTNPQASLLFARNEGLQSVNQDLGTGTGMLGWRRSAFESLKDTMGGVGRVRPVDPGSDASLSDGSVTEAQFDAGGRTWDGLPTNSLVVYALRDRSKGGTGLLGEAGIEPGSPVLAQWWNTGSGDVAASSFPGVLRSYASNWIPLDFSEVVQLNHGFTGKVQFPGLASSDLIARVLLQAALLAPKGSALLTVPGGAGPVVTPIRNLAVADLKANTATGSVALGNQLDLVAGNAANLALGGPKPGDPPFKLFDGNNKGPDHRLMADSTLEISFNPSATDARSPSGYIVTLYQVTPQGSNPARTRLTVLREIRVGHAGGRGAAQKIYLPNLRSMAPGSIGSNLAFALKVRSLWLEGDEGPDANSLDLEKQPFAQRIPSAWADFLSGVFVGAY